MWVEYLYIEVGTLETATPKSVFCDIQSGTIFGVGGSSGKNFSRQRLQVWFHAYVVAYFGQPAANGVSHLIVPDGWESTL